MALCVSCLQALWESGFRGETTSNSVLSLKNKCYDFIMASKQKESEKRKHVNLSICEKLELIMKLESGVSVVLKDDFLPFGGQKINSQVTR